MEYNEFVSLTKQTRTAQKKFFAMPGNVRDNGNKQLAQSEAMKLERRLDQAIKDFEGNQTRLF
tara:strand:+ start:1062 stop:1250 length:189 start_codon:yes stop_codon:yes gene_type:complete